MSLRNVQNHEDCATTRWIKDNMFYRKHEMPRETIYYLSGEKMVNFNKIKSVIMTLPYFIYNDIFYKIIIKKTKNGMNSKCMKNIVFDFDGSMRHVSNLK